MTLAHPRVRALPWQVTVADPRRLRLLGGGGGLAGSVRKD